jgi:hypothetical protein
MNHIIHVVARKVCCIDDSLSEDSFNPVRHHDAFRRTRRSGGVHDGCSVVVMGLDGLVYSLGIFELAPGMHAPLLVHLLMSRTLTSANHNEVR